MSPGAAAPPARTLNSPWLRLGPFDSHHDLIVRIRWERAKREALEPGTAVHLAVGVTEARLIRELHHRFGVETITASDLEWYVRVDHGRGHRERAEPA